MNILGSSPADVLTTDPSFEGDLTTTGSATIDGNLTVSGTTTTINSETLVVEDPMVLYGKNNAANLNDGGYILEYNDGAKKYAGIIRDKSDTNIFKVVDDLTAEPTTTNNNTTLYDSKLQTIKASNFITPTADLNSISTGISGTVTVHSDVSNAGSGIIITAGERTQITTNQTDIGLLDGRVDVLEVPDPLDGLITSTSDPESPSEVDVKDLGNSHNSVSIDPTRQNIYTSCGGSLCSYTYVDNGTMTNQQSLSVAGTLSDARPDLAGNFVYVSAGTNFHKVDATTINAMTVSQSISGGTFLGMDIVNSRIFVARAAGGFQEYNTSLGSVNSYVSASNGRCCAFDNSFTPILYGGTNNGVVAVNTSTWTLHNTAITNHSGNTNAIFLLKAAGPITKDLVFCGTANGNLYIYDTSTQLEFLLKNNTDLTAGAAGITGIEAHIVNNKCYMYVGLTGDGWKLYEITADGATVTERFAVDPATAQTGITVDTTNELVFTSSSGDGVRAYTYGGALNFTVASTFDSYINLKKQTTTTTIPPADSVQLYAKDGLRKGLFMKDSNNNDEEILKGECHFSTGLCVGGVLTIGAPTTTFTVSDGHGYIQEAGVNYYVSWTGKTNIAVTNIASQNITFVSIDKDGTIIQQGTPFTNTQRRSLLIFGVVVHVNRTSVDAINTEAQVLQYNTNQVYDLYDALGFMNVSGNIFSANSGLLITKSVGTIFKTGSNYDIDTLNPHLKTLPILGTVTFEYRYSDGTSEAPLRTAIDPDNLDNLSGGLTALGNNKWSIQRIYSFISNNVKIQRGQNEYDSLESAIVALAQEPFTVETSIANNGLYRCALILQKGTADLTDLAEATFISIGKFGETAQSSGTVTDLTGYVSKTDTTTQNLLSTLNIVNGKQLQANVIDTATDSNNMFIGSSNLITNNNRVNIANPSLNNPTRMINTTVPANPPSNNNDFYFETDNLKSVNSVGTVSEYLKNGASEYISSTKTANQSILSNTLNLVNIDNPSSVLGLGATANYVSINNPLLSNQSLLTTIATPGTNPPASGVFFYNKNKRLATKDDLGVEKEYLYTTENITDHGGLSGLADDDHAQYLLLGTGRGTQTVNSLLINNGYQVFTGQLLSTSLVGAGIFANNIQAPIGQTTNIQLMNNELADIDIGNATKNVIVGGGLNVTGQLQCTSILSGTWTPTISFSVSGALTETTQIGEWSRIGKKIFFSVRIVWSGHSGTPPNGNATINLHTTVTGDRLHASFGYLRGVTFSNMLLVTENTGSSVLRMFDSVSAGVPLDLNQTNFTNIQGEMQISGHFDG